MNDGDADGLELRDVENFVVVEIVDVTVGNEIKIGAADGAGGGKGCELRAIFEDRRTHDASAVVGEFECGYARRAESILNGYEAAVVKVEAVGACECGVRAGVYVNARKSFQVNAEDAERVSDEECVVIGRPSDAVGVEKIAMGF